MALTPEGIYFYGLLTILAEGPTQSVELVEGRPVPDLASLAGEDERLRELAERQPSVRVHPDSRRLIESLSKLPGMRWNLLRTQGSCQVYNSTPGFPAWYKLSVQKLRNNNQNGQRGIRVAVQALDPESAAIDAAKSSPLRRLLHGAVLMMIAGVFVIITVGKGGLGISAWVGVLVPATAVAIIFLVSWAWKKVSERKSKG